MNAKWTFAAAMCLWTIGCNAVPDDAPREVVRSQRQAIVGGWNATWASSVVALVDASNRVQCTGTLVSPRAVITAAHCKAAGATKVLFGQSVTAADARWSSIASFVAHPDFDRKTLASDIALVALATPAPADIAPARLGDEPLDGDFVGKHVALLGYGLDAVGGETARRGGRAQVSAVDARTFQTIPDPSQPCHGDSGGPVLVDTETATIVLGVISSGDDNCTDHTTYTRLDAFRASFVDPALAKLADGAVRVGERCFHDGSCVDGGTCHIPNRNTDRAYCTHTCTHDADCPSAMRCNSNDAGSLCAFEVTPGAASAPCFVDSDCDSMQCARDDGRAVCLQACIPGALACPEGFVCTAESKNGDRNGCRRAKGVVAQRQAPAAEEPEPEEEAESSGGCTASRAASGASSGILVLTLAGGVLARRRRATERTVRAACRSSGRRRGPPSDRRPS